MLEEYKDKELLIITPNSNKLKLLKELVFYNIKYMTIEEFKNSYFYSYDNKALDYLISKYNYHIDVSKVILNNLYDISIDREYKSEKLKSLQSLKKDLLAKNLLKEDLLFKNSLSKKKIFVINYYNLEKYLEETLKKENANFINNQKKEITCPIIHCKTLEDEISFVIQEIIELTKKKVSLNNIYLANVKESDKYTIRKLFKYFNIPINLEIKTSIYGTTEVKSYLENETINLDNPTNITKSLVGAINSLVEIKDSKNYEIFLKDKLKSTAIKEEKYLDAVKLINLEEISISDDDYVFVIGFNQDILPITYKDESFISDSLKEEVNYYNTDYKNRREKETIITILSNINNLFLSYRDKDNFNNYLKASLINELGLIEKEYINNNYNYSNTYNLINLGISLDKYYKYNEIDSNLSKLYKTYQNIINYNTYSNQFTNISNDKLLSFIKEPLTISYTSLNNYNKCSFSYYIKHLLKLDPFEDNFNLLLGNLFHHLASISFNEDFDFNKEWEKYLINKEFTIKEKYFLISLKEQMKSSLDIIKEQYQLSEYKDNLFEHNISIDLDKKIDAVLVGNIDRIIYRKNISDTYFTVIDYKTGGIDTNINNMKYGIGMQLVIYLYLISCSRLFDSAIFTGMYFQRVLYPNLKWEKNKSPISIRKNELKLMGYSTTDLEELEIFDSTYQNSELIKGMKTLKSGEIDSRCKVLSDEDIYNILEFTKKIINKTVDNILEGDFSINPKIIDYKDITCKYCKYSDICYVKENNKIYLEKVENLDFLGDDINDN